MIGRALRLVFDSVAGQVIVLLVLSIASMHVALTTYFFLSNPRLPAFTSPAETVGEIATAAHILAATPPAGRAPLIDSIHQVLPTLAACTAPIPADARRLERGPLPGKLGEAGAAFKVETPTRGGEPWSEFAGRLYLRLADGSCYTLDLEESPSPGFFGPTSFTLLFLLVATVVLVSWAIIVITGPLRRFEAAVEQLRDMHSDEAVKEDGPRELRSAISAFNRMRARIGKLMSEKTTMLAAVSHDLRTPITRLRLRVEFIEDASIREPMLADLDHMAALAQVALTHLSGTDSREPFDPIDLPSLLQTIADQFADLGHNVSYDGPHRLTANIRARDIQRAVTNLVENAVRYGSVVTISMEKTSATRLSIIVSDDGPGIPADQRAHLLEPFVRGDSARTALPNSGFGLGLTIARDVAEAHGGGIELADNSPKGLRAILDIRA